MLAAPVRTVSANVVSIPTKSGPSSTKCEPTSTTLGPTSAKVGRTRPGGGPFRRFRPYVWPMLADTGAHQEPRLLLPSSRFMHELSTATERCMYSNQCARDEVSAHPLVIALVLALLSCLEFLRGSLQASRTSTLRLTSSPRR